MQGNRRWFIGGINFGFFHKYFRTTATILVFVCNYWYNYCGYRGYFKFKQYDLQEIDL